MHKRNFTIIANGPTQEDAIVTTSGDVIKKCTDCERDFIIHVKEQDWYYQRSMTLPKRCRACRIQRRRERESNELQPI